MAIRVTVELLPGGDESQADHRGTATIANDGTGTENLGNYTVTLFGTGEPNGIWKRGRVLGFPRGRLGVWDLLYLALRSTVGERNP